jgi:hypothetical protein
MLSGCGGSRKEQLAVSVDGRAVVAEAFDNQRLDRHWSCGSLRAAVSSLPMDVSDQGSIVDLLRAAAGRSCDEALKRVRKGMTRGDIETLLGRPDGIARCLVFRWPSTEDSSVDGARMCFEGGKVSFVQTAEHL